MARGDQSPRPKLPVHFIYHVPKCAGQTVNRHLATFLPQDAYCRTRKLRSWRRPFSNRYVVGQLPDPDRTLAIGGHFLSVSLGKHFDRREIKRSILLRDPVSHLVSYYNFRMMRYASQGLHPYSFRLSYFSTQRNFISHFILRNFLGLSWLRLALLSDEEKYDVLNAFLAGFWYVGDYSLCDNLVAALATELSVPGSATPENTCAQWQRRVTWESLDLSDLTASAVAEIRRDNLLDQRLWETWRDVEHQTAKVRPCALYGRSARSFVRTEAVRFVSQIMRRVKRRGGLLGTAQAPTLEEGLAQALE